jgi:CheY-like chemotaxis protein
MANILLVDDDDAFRRMMRLLLCQLGHEVVDLPNGAEAWASFQAKPAEVVIMDLIMPEKEGLETIRQFKRSGAKTKILAISGGGRVDARDMLVIASQFGADHVLAKPFSKEDLVTALNRLLPAKKD